MKTVTKLVKTREVRHIGPDGQPVDLEFAAGNPTDFIQYPSQSHPGFIEGAPDGMSYFEGQPPSPANYDYYGRAPPPGPANYPPGTNFQVRVMIAMYIPTQSEFDSLICDDDLSID